MSLLNFTYGMLVLPESLPPESRRAFHWKRANPLGTLLQLRRYPVVLALLIALFLWQLAHQVMPSTWAFYTMFKFGWSTAVVGGSLAFVGLIMAVSQATLPRVLIPRLGEAKCVIIGLSFGLVGFVGYAFATRGWMMFALLLTWFLGALAMPSTNALMSHRIPLTAQGELQGGVASLFSLSSIIGPPIMTQLFGFFSRDNAPIRFPGAAFIASAALTIGSLLLFRRALHAESPRIVTPEPLAQVSESA